MLFPISVTHIVYTNENAILNNKLIHCVLDLLIQHSGGRLRLPPGLLQAQVAQRLQVSHVSEHICDYRVFTKHCGFFYSISCT